MTTMGDPMEEVERAAERTRARERRRRRKERAAVPTPGKRVRDEKRAIRDTIEKSVAEADSDLRQYAQIAIMGAVLLAAVWAENEIPALRRFRDHTAGMAVLVVVDIALCVVALVVPTKALARWRLRHLHRIGHGFDVARYLELLGQKRSYGTLRVTLRCLRAWDARQRHSMLDAIKSWDKDVKASWSADDHLELHTDKLRTLAETLGDDIISPTKFFTNRPVHDAFMRIVHRVLPKLDAANPVEQITVAIDGEVYPWDTDPNEKHRFF